MSKTRNIIKTLNPLFLIAIDETMEVLEDEINIPQGM